MKTPTEQFRECLKMVGIAEPKSYEWLDGEAWYRGEPIQGRATESEQKAINFTSTILSIPKTWEQVARFEAMNAALIESIPPIPSDNLLERIRQKQRTMTCGCSFEARSLCPHGNSDLA